MKKIFSSPDLLEVRALATFLEAKGFKVSVEGENRMSAAGGLAPTDCWLEIVLLDDATEKRALDCISEFKRAAEGSKALPSWKCPTCGEEVEGQFTHCWRCAAGEPKDVRKIDPETARLSRYFYSLVIIGICLSLLADHLYVSSFANSPAAVQQYIIDSIKIAPSTAEPIYAVARVLIWIEWIGLLLFWNFARYLMVGLWTFQFVQCLFFIGFTVNSNWFTACDLAVSLVGGSVITLAFLSPLSRRFQEVNLKEAKGK